MTEKSNPLGSTIVTQVGLVVPDIQQAAMAYSCLLGLPLPEIMITDPVEKANTIYRGASTPAQAKLAFFEMGQVTLELIEPVGGPSTWQEFLDQRGPGVHHIAFNVKSIDQVTEQLGTQGIPVAQQGDFTGGRYSYLDSMAQLNLVIELLEHY